MLLAALDGLVARFGLSGETSVRSPPVRCPNTPVTSTSPGKASCRPVWLIRPPPKTCSRRVEPSGAAILVADKIVLGQIDPGIAGGVDSASDAPIAVGDGL